MVGPTFHCCSVRNLELSKCGYHFMHYTTKDDEFPVMRNAVGDNVKLKTVDGQ